MPRKFGAKQPLTEEAEERVVEPRKAETVEDREVAAGDLAGGKAAESIEKLEGTIPDRPIEKDDAGQASGESRQQPGNRARDRGAADPAGILCFIDADIG